MSVNYTEVAEVLARVQARLDAEALPSFQAYHVPDSAKFHNSLRCSILANDLSWYGAPALAVDFYSMEPVSRTESYWHVCYQECFSDKVASLYGEQQKVRMLLNTLTKLHAAVPSTSFPESLQRTAPGIKSMRSFTSRLISEKELKDVLDPFVRSASAHAQYAEVLATQSTLFASEDDFEYILASVKRDSSLARVLVTRGHETHPRTYALLWQDLPTIVLLRGSYEELSNCLLNENSKIYPVAKSVIEKPSNFLETLNALCSDGLSAYDAVATAAALEL